MTLGVNENDSLMLMYGSEDSQDACGSSTLSLLQIKGLPAHSPHLPLALTLWVAGPRKFLGEIAVLVGAGEMDQSVTCLPCKKELLGSLSKTCKKKKNQQQKHVCGHVCPHTHVCKHTRNSLVWLSPSWPLLWSIKTQMEAGQPNWGGPLLR